MYIYNVTINIDKSVHDEWLNWIHIHIEDVLATGKFVSAKLTQVLVEEEMGGATLRGSGLSKFADKMLTFRTELKVVKEFYPVSTHN